MIIPSWMIVGCFGCGKIIGVWVGTRCHTCQRADANLKNNRNQTA